MSRNASSPLSSHQDISLALDIYGPLLSLRQQKALILHLEEDLSLTEVAAVIGVAPQTIHEHVQTGLDAMRNYEKKLRLVKRRRTHRARLLALAEKARGLGCRNHRDIVAAGSLASSLEKIAEAL